MAKEEKDIVKLKEEYEKIRKKYSLPTFSELNEDFSIEKISDVETDILIRKVRNVVGDKLANYMRFLENLINPVNVPMFIFSITKLLTAEDKKKLSDTYNELTKLEIKFIQTDLMFEEEKEAKFIIDGFKFWQTAKKEAFAIFEKVNKKWDDKSESNNNKGYFG